MTDQFSEAYLEYLKTDRARVLQKVLPRQGEGVWFTERSQNLSQTKWMEWSEPSVLSQDEPDYILDYEDYEDMEFLIVPTFRQLIGIIKGAGYDWAKDVNGAWTGFDDRDSPPKTIRSYSATDDMLAAAHLAVKALES